MLWQIIYWGMSPIDRGGYCTKLVYADSAKEAERKFDAWVEEASVDNEYLDPATKASRIFEVETMGRAKGW